MVLPGELPDRVPVVTHGSEATRPVAERLGFRTSGLRNIQLRTALSGIRDAGFSVVEFCLEHGEVSASSHNPAGIARLVDSALDAGLEPSAMSYHGKTDDPERRGRLLSCAFEAARLAGVGLVVCGSPAVRPGDPPGLEALAREIEGPCERAGGMVGVALEPEPDTVVADLDCLEELSEIAAFPVGVNLDIGHALLSEKDFGAALERALPACRHLHLDDMRRGRHQHLVPGHGDVPWDVVSRFLGHYAGPVVVDIFRLPSDPWRLVASSFASTLEVLRLE